jgi:hypothetical protein
MSSRSDKLSQIVKELGDYLYLELRKQNQHSLENAVVVCLALLDGHLDAFIGHSSGRPEDAKAAMGELTKMILKLSGAFPGANEAVEVHLPRGERKLN